MCPVADLTVVIPTLNRAQSLPRALAALARSAAGHDVEVMVVSDAKDTDPQAAATALAESGLPGRHLVAEQPGAAAARNAGVAAGTAPLILFTDDDVLAGRRMVGGHLEWHRRHAATETGVLGRVVWAKEVQVTPFMRWLERGYQFDYGSIDGERAGWGHFYTANISVTRELFERVGGFDEVRFPFFFEDLDLGLRMTREGLDLRYSPAAVAEHLHEIDAGEWQQRMRRVGAMERRFCRLHPEAVPYLHDRLTKAASQPAVRGRSVVLARHIGPRMPLIGPRLWAIVDLYYRQQSAPAFLAGWEAENQGSFDDSEWLQPSGSEPSGPK